MTKRQLQRIKRESARMEAERLQARDKQRELESRLIGEVVGFTILRKQTRGRVFEWICPGYIRAEINARATATVAVHDIRFIEDEEEIKK